MDEQTMHFKRIEVKCCSGDLLNEQPVSFMYNNREYLVVEIVDCWYEGSWRQGRPAMNYFKVRTTGGDEFIIRYNTLFDAWAVLSPRPSPR